MGGTLITGKRNVVDKKSRGAQGNSPDICFGGPSFPGEDTSSSKCVSVLHVDSLGGRIECLWCINMG